jgi:hypothetical protein
VTTKFLNFTDFLMTTKFLLILGLWLIVSRINRGVCLPIVVNQTTAEGGEQKLVLDETAHSVLFEAEKKRDDFEETSTLKIIQHSPLSPKQLEGIIPASLVQKAFDRIQHLEQPKEQQGMSEKSAATQDIPKQKELSLETQAIESKSSSSSTSEGSSTSGKDTTKLEQ